MDAARRPDGDAAGGLRLNDRRGGEPIIEQQLHIRHILIAPNEVLLYSDAQYQPDPAAADHHEAPAPFDPGPVLAYTGLAYTGDA